LLLPWIIGFKTIIISFVASSQQQIKNQLKNLEIRYF